MDGTPNQDQVPAAERDPLARATYSIDITHGWDGELRIAFRDIAETPHAQRHAAWALRLAADALEEGRTLVERPAVASPGPSNVVALREGGPGPQPGTPEKPDPGLAKALAKVFSLARDGHLKSFVGTGFLFSGDRVEMLGGAIADNIFEMVGAIDWLKDEYRARVRPQPVRPK